IGVDRMRSTKIAPEALSTSYLTGSASFGISMMTLISSGGFLPAGTRSRPMREYSSKAEGARLVARLAGHFSRHPAALQQPSRHEGVPGRKRRVCLAAVPALPQLLSAGRPPVEVLVGPALGHLPGGVAPAEAEGERDGHGHRAQYQSKREIDDVI